MQRRACTRLTARGGGGGGGAPGGPSGRSIPPSSRTLRAGAAAPPRRPPAPPAPRTGSHRAPAAAAAAGPAAGWRGPGWWGDGVESLAMSHVRTPPRARMPKQIPVKSVSSIFRLWLCQPTVAPTWRVHCALPYQLSLLIATISAELTHRFEKCFAEL